MQNVSTQQKVLAAVTEGLSEKIDAEVNSGNIEWSFPNTFVLNDLYVEDQQKDTLVFVDRARLTVNILPLFEQRISIRTVQLTGMRGFVREIDSLGTMNFQFVVDAFKKKDSTQSKWSADIESIGLKDCGISFHRDSVNLTPGKFNPRFIDIENLNGNVFVRNMTLDSINFRLHKLCFTERSGLVLSNLSANLVSNNDHLSLLYFTTEMPKSKLSFNRCNIKYADLKSKDFFHDYNIDLELNPSKVALTDLKAFVPAFSTLPDVFHINGSFNGTLSNLDVKRLRIQDGEDLVLDADLHVKGLPNFKTAYLKADFNQVSASAADVKRICSPLIGREVFLPEAFENLKTIAFSGNVDGTLADMKAKGEINTAPGKVVLDVSIKNPNAAFETYTIDGSVETHNYHLGDVLPKSELGDASLGLKVKLRRLSSEKKNDFAFDAEGTVDSLSYKGYTYHNITINGDFGANGFNGDLEVNDPNAKFSFTGNVNLLAKRPVFKFDADVSKVCLTKLNLSKSNADACLSFNMDADFQGKEFDDLEGALTIDNFLLQRASGKDLLVNNVNVNITPANAAGVKKAQVVSDFVNGSISGKYQLASLKDNVMDILRRYVPAVIADGSAKTKGNNFDFQFSVSNTEVLSDVFGLSVAMISDGTIKGFFNDITDKFCVRIEAPLLRVGKKQIEDALILCENPKSQAKLICRATMLPQNNRRSPVYFSLNANAFRDSIDSRINFSNSVNETYSGELAVLSVLKSLSKEGLSADFFIKPTEFILKDSVWTMHKSKIELRPGNLSVNGFLIDHADQSLSINGFNTSSMEDSIGVFLKDIQLSYISNMINAANFGFAGIANGKVFMHKLFNKPFFTAKLGLDAAEINDAPIGDLSVDSHFDTKEKNIFFNGDIFSAVNKARSPYHGGVFLGRDSMSIKGDLVDIDLRFLRRYFGKVLADFNGLASGKVHAFGKFGNIGLEGHPIVKNASFGIEFLNTKYSIDRDTVYMTPTSFALKGATVKDEFGNKGKTMARIRHKGFKDWKFNVDVDCDNVLALNTSEMDNETFYGKAFADGLVNINGNTNAIKFSMKVKSRENTVVTIPIGGTNDVGKYDYITFVNDEEKQSAAEKRRNRRDKIRRIIDEKNMSTRVILDMQVEATPDAQIQLIMDPRAGDIIKTRGNGVIRINYDTQTSDFGMLGTYEVTKGEYLFTIQSVISRKFSILPGSRLHFTGSPYTAGLDVQAKYSLNASLTNILDDANYNSATSANVDCLLFLTGTIQNPIIKFGLELPNADEEVKRKLASVVNTEESLNRNVASLLALGHFYTMDKSSAQSGATGNSELTSVGFSTLSSEVGNLLSRINNDVNVGVNYNPGSDADASAQEFEVALSTQFLNDRLLVNGNFGYREANPASLNNNTSGILDFDIEYKLTPSGKFRFKAFNRTDNSYFRQTNNGTQGVGLSYREDFDTYTEWFNRYWNPVKGVFSKKSRVKNASQKASKTDSTKVKATKADSTGGTSLH